MGYGLVNGFIDHLYTPLGTTRYYGTTVNLHNVQITTAPAEPFPALCVRTSHSMAMVSNSGDSSLSRIQVLPSPALVHKCLPAIPTNELDHHLYPASLAELNCTQHCQTTTLFFYHPLSESQSYFVTGSLLPISSSWCHAPSDS
jgi:hypothetical protein